MESPVTHPVLGILVHGPRILFGPKFAPSRILHMYSPTFRTARTDGRARVFGFLESPERIPAERTTDGGHWR